MRRMRRSTRLVAVACGLSLITAAACGGDDDDDDTDATEAPEATEAPSETEAPADTEAPGTTTAGTDAPGTTAAAGEAPDEGAAAGETAMTVTVDLNPDAVWQDGSPITVADLECTWRAVVEHAGFDPDGRLRQDPRRH